MFLKIIFINITALIVLHGFVGNLQRFSEGTERLTKGFNLSQDSLDLSQDTLAVEEREILFIIDGREFFMKRTDLMKKINLDNVLYIKIQQKPIPADLLNKYGEQAKNGIINITSKEGKKDKIFE